MNTKTGTLSGAYDFRRICYLLKSPDFVRKVGGHAPDYPGLTIYRLH